MAKGPRILYFGMVNTEGYSRSVGGRCFVGAAAGKMAAVICALRMVGENAFLVSLPFVGADHSRSFVSGRLTHRDGFPCEFLFTTRNPWLRKVLGLFSFAHFAVFKVRANDIVLFYNHGIEYALALLILRLRGVASFQDIEDVPTDSDNGMRGLLNRIGFWITLGLTSPRKVVASVEIGRKLGIQTCIAVYGVYPAGESKSDEKIWDELYQGGPLRIHFGGTLARSTGVNIFCETLVLLSQRQKRFRRKIQFIVTGVGESEKLEELLAKVRGLVDLELYFGIDRKRYKDLLGSCHASLSLRDPMAGISNTTFPSKVIEIASNGLAVVTTVVSDVPAIFNEKNAYLLNEFRAEALAGLFEKMMDQPEDLRARAIRARNTARERFSAPEVGASLACFLRAKPTGRV